ncbi:MAG: DASH family cryptochrome [Betaproteobacteria bacterium]|nr:DASH family cryptochrome [Betaproteobacteria bacterium]
MMGKQAIYWFRRDCRLTDNPLLHRALQECDEVLPVFIENAQLNQATPWGFSRQGSHLRAFKAQLLVDLRAQLERLGAVLWLAEGDPVALLISWCRSLNIQHIYAETIAAEEEELELRQLKEAGIQVHSLFQSSMIDINAVQRIITYFPMSFTRCRQKIEVLGLRFSMPLTTALEQFKIAQNWRESEQSRFVLYKDLEYQLEPNTSLPVVNGKWITDEERVKDYIVNDYLGAHHAAHYKLTRNQLQGVDYSSKWSIWLAHGIVSARTLMHELQHYEKTVVSNESTYWLWFELLWRDYFRYLFYQRTTCLFRYQGLSAEPISAPPFNKNDFLDWSQGNTGFELIDAAMRELLTTGYLSNRLRQVVASFWLYHYRGDWRVGAAWFESQLIDYDVYSNYGNWLYIAGKGTDPQGGREFNVDKQVKQFDPNGDYRQRWLGKH